jgi:alcohol dehydrogenase (NADP+)
MTKIQGYASHGKGQDLKLWEYEAHPLRPTDIHIKISHCGICHSDIHTLDSGWGPTKYPVIVGHEIVGEITEVGSEVTKFKVGDRVGVGAQCSSCHKCHHCEIGAENVCTAGVFTYNSVHPDGGIAYGGYAKAVRVPFQFAFKIPQGLSSAEAAPLLCAGVTVFAPLKRHMTPGCRVGVIGIGGLGHLGIQFASKLGASEVVAISTSSKKEADAKALGADRMLISNDQLQMKANFRALDVVLCTANSTDMPWESYLSLIAPGGKLIIVGIPEDKIKLNIAALIFAQVTMVGSLIGSTNEIEEMLAFADKRKVSPWIEKMPMSKVNEALARVRKNDVRFRFVLEN